jgi:hypothetical protein
LLEKRNGRGFPPDEIPVNQLRSLHFHLIDKNGKIPEGVLLL